MKIKLHNHYWRFGLGFVCLLVILTVGVNKEGRGEQAPIHKQSVITGKDIFNAFRSFSTEYDANNSNLQQKAIEQEKYEQMTVDDYRIAWGMLPANYSYIAVFKLQDSVLKPLSFNLVGEQIDAINLLEDSVGKQASRLFEVKGYGGSGSNQTGIVHLFLLNKEKVTEVWNQVFLRKDTDSKNITTISKSYYSLQPAKYYNGLNNLSITVFETNQQITGDDNGNILARGKEEVTAKPTQYVWNDEDELFKPIGEFQ